MRLNSEIKDYFVVGSLMSVISPITFCKEDIFLGAPCLLYVTLGPYPYSNYIHEGCHPILLLDLKFSKHSGVKMANIGDRRREYVTLKVLHKKEILVLHTTTDYAKICFNYIKNISL